MVYWQDPVYGKRRGVVSCRDGHVRIVDVAQSDVESVTQAVAEVCNGLDEVPPSQAELLAALLKAGFAEAGESEVTPPDAPAKKSDEAPKHDKPAALKKAPEKAAKK